jgi:hypothetical protein
MCSSGLAGTKQHEFFDGMYAIRGIIPPRPACGERIEVRGRAQSDTRGLRRVSVCKVTSAYGIGKLQLTQAFSAWLSCANRIPGALPQADMTERLWRSA